MNINKKFSVYDSTWNSNLIKYFLSPLCLNEIKVLRCQMIVTACVTDGEFYYLK